MTGIAAAPRRRSNLALWSLVLLGVGLLSLLPLALSGTGSRSGDSSTAALIAATGPRVAYFAFDRTADTLWLADPTNPSARSQGLVIQHAPDYGVVPTLSPDGRSLAYLVLPPETPAPGPDSPARLWVTPLAGNGPILVAEGADLLVPAVWTRDGSALVFRRSDGEGSSLSLARVDGSPETELVSSENALFPVAFAHNGGLLYVEVSSGGSRLRSLDGSLDLLLSEGLTRDWALSPDGTRLAYLEMTLSSRLASSRAYVLDLTTGRQQQAGAPDSDAFAPAWAADGSLVIGQLKGEGASAAVRISGDSLVPLTAPVRGFDVPLAVDSAGGAAVTSFSGSSILNPGQASLVVVTPDGTRREIATGEVTFLGWISP